MSNQTPFALLANATSLPQHEIPEWPVTELVGHTARELARGARLCTWFGVPERSGTRLVSVLAFDADNALAVARSAPFRGDANDHLYQWESSRDYNASPGLERIKATLLAINSADDERNPPELGLLDREIKRVPNGRVLLIPASDQTAGHGTTGQARFWKASLAELLQGAPRGK